MRVLLFIQNISPFLIGLNLTYNSWLAAILDQILKKFAMCEKWLQSCSEIVRLLNN